jgi:hypothetical protein
VRKKKTVPSRLAELGKLYEERNAAYGNPFLDFGQALHVMFGGRLVLETPEEFGRFSLFMAHIGKISRYCASIKKGGHADSMDDLAVYAAILREYDDEWAERRKGKK